jgi:hypothetical protein
MTHVDAERARARAPSDGGAKVMGPLDWIWSVRTPTNGTPELLARASHRLGTANDNGLTWHQYCEMVGIEQFTRNVAAQFPQYFEVEEKEKNGA